MGTYVFISFGCIPRSRIVRPYGTSMFNISRICSARCQRTHTILHSLQQSMMALPSLCPCPPLLTAVSVGLRASHHGFHGHFPGDWRCWAALHVTSLEKCLFISFVCFLNGTVLLLLDFKSSLCILAMSRQKYDLQISFPILWVIVHFLMQKTLLWSTIYLSFFLLFVLLVL